MLDLCIAASAFDTIRIMSNRDGTLQSRNGTPEGLILEGLTFISRKQEFIYTPKETMKFKNQKLISRNIDGSFQKKRNIDGFIDSDR